MLFKSKLCDVCKTTLQQAFETLDDPATNQTPHHATKESFVDSILHRNCHLCRLIIYHFKSAWALFHREGLGDIKEEPTSLTEDDFAESDFDFGTFPSDRVTVLSYMLELPETIGLHARIKRWGDGGDGTFGLLVFDCEGLNSHKPGFWVFDERGTVLPSVQTKGYVNHYPKHLERLLPRVERTRTPQQSAASIR
jgi:hypothetical protein